MEYPNIGQWNATKLVSGSLQNHRFTMFCFSGCISERDVSKSQGSASLAMINPHFLYDLPMSVAIFHCQVKGKLN